MADEKYTSTLSGQQMDDAFNQMNQRIPEGWAVGTKDGVDVPSTSIFYHNNAKYYAEQAAAMFDSLAAQYDSSQTYAFGDLCRVGNVLYICINPSGTTGTFVSADWRATTFEELIEQFEYEDENNDGNVVAKGAPTGAYTPVILKTLRLPFLKNKYLLPFARQIEDTAQNDPANSSFNIEVNNAEESPALSTVIKGKTAAQNQLVADGGFTDATNWAATNATLSLSNNVARSTCTTAGLINIKPAATVKYIAGHVYYQRVYARSSTPEHAARLSTALSVTEPTTTSSSFVELEVIGSRSSDTTAAYPQVIMQNASVGDYIEAKWMVNFDLTARGFTAAEYASASALKAAWLKKYGTPIPLFSPYDGGSLANVNGEYRMRGRNLWDEEWEVGGINSQTGQNSASTTTIRSTNYIRVNPTETLYLKTAANTMWLYEYDAEKNYIGRTGYSDTTVTLKPETAFVRFIMGSNYGTTYKHDITINLSDSSINGQYIPSYNGGSIDLSSAPLNGVGTAQDEEDFATGERTTRIWLDDMGDLTWYKNNTWGFYAAPSHVAKNFINGQIGNGVCSAYPTGEGKGAPDTGTFVVYGDYIRIGDTSYADVAAFKTAMTGQKVCYEMLTPITTTETPQPLETQYGYNCLEPVSGGVQSASVSMKYGKNIKNYIDEQIAELQALVLENI